MEYRLLSGASTVHVDKIVCWMFFIPSDSWQLAHGEITMRTGEHLNSVEELMPSFYEADSPDSEDDDGFLPDFDFDTAKS